MFDLSDHPLVAFWAYSAGSSHHGCAGGGFRSRHSVQRKLVFSRSFITFGVCRHLRYDLCVATLLGGLTQ